MRPSLLALLAMAIGCAPILGIEPGEANRGGGGTTTSQQGGMGGGDGGAGGSGASGGSVANGGAGGLLPCSEDYASVVEADNPALYLRFEETSGSLVTAEDDDTTGMVGVNAILDTDGLPPCVGGSAIGFPGMADQDISGLPSLGFPGVSSFSIEAWIRTDDLTGNIVHRLGGIPDAWHGYSFRFENTKLTLFRYAVNTDKVEVDSSVVGALATHHVVATFDGTTSQMCLYVDGVAYPCADSSRVIDTNQGSFRIGGAGYQGVIDELAVYPRALGLDRIQAHYAAGAGAP